MRKLPSFAVAVILLLSGFFGFCKAQDNQKVNIAEAQHKGLVKVEASGAGLSAVTLRLTRTTEANIVVVIPVGTYFVNKGNAQDMIARKETKVDLSKEKERSVDILASCANAHKSLPDNSSRFDVVAAPSSEELKRLIDVIGKDYSGEQRAAQVAVWITTDDIDSDDPLLTWISDNDIVKALQMLKEAGMTVSGKSICSSRDSSILYLHVSGPSSVVRRIGRVDFGAVMGKFPGVANVQHQLDSFVTSWQNELQRMQNKWQQKYEEYDKRKLTMSDQTRAEAERELAALEKSITDYRNQKFGPNGDLFDKQSELMKPITLLLSEMKEIIRRVGVERRYDIVVDRLFIPLCSPIILHDKEIVFSEDSQIEDITDLVISKYENVHRRK